MLRSHLKSLLIITLLGIAVGTSVKAELPPEVAQRLLEELKYLASDDLEGRGVGTAGLDKAAGFVAQSFRDAGLKVTVDDGDAYQEFEVVSGAELTSPNTLTFAGPAGQQVELSYDEDFRTCSFGKSGEFSAPLVFCGYGIEADDEEYNDFAGVDVEGKVVIILRRTPQQDEPEGRFSGQGFSRYAALNTKLMAARKHKAAAVLFVNDPYTSHSEADKLAQQLDKARQSVIDTAVSIVTGQPLVEKNDPHGSPHGPPASPHGAAESNPHANPHATPAANPLAGIPAEDKSATPDPLGPAAASNPHAPAENPHAAHGHGTESAGIAADQQQLAAAVRHLQEVQHLVDMYDPDPLMSFGYNGYRAGASLPCFHITQEVCDRLLTSAVGTTLAELEAKIDETGTPHSVELPQWTASGASSLKLVREQVMNVIGVLEGEGPLADETIIIGAHYDHIGWGGEGSMAPGVKEIHNGADDNASGTTALLELARRIAQRGSPPPRRLVFIAFTGEERGLLGSAHYVKEPLFPLENTVAMFNMDMVGRLTDDKLTVFGTGTSSWWEHLLDEAATKYGFQLSRKPEGFGPSDHSSFYAKEIPVLHFFTGTHNDYHRPSDDWDKINVDGMGRIISMLEDLVLDTATNEDRPEYVAVKGRASIQPRTGSRPYFGSIPDFSTEGSGYAIQGVSPDSPAAKGGLKGGDVIIRLGEQEITGLDDFDLALRNFSPGEQVQVVVLRQGEEVTLTVTLATPRG